MPTVCTFSGASDAHTSTGITAAVRQAAGDMAEAGWDLIYGGTSYGLMGVIAETFLQHGRHVTGIIPTALLEACGAGGIMPGIELIQVKDMFERKQRMLAFGDAFITLPGGIGTLDEMTEVLSHRYFADFCPDLPYAWAKPHAMLLHSRADELLHEYLLARREEGLISAQVLSHLHVGRWPSCLAYLRQNLNH